MSRWKRPARGVFSGGVAHQQSARLTCERQRGRHSPPPPFSEGIAQPVRAGASHAPGRRRESSCPHHFCPCGVVQLTRLPLKQEITGSRDRAGRSGTPVLRPPKHSQRCASSVRKRAWCNSGWGLHRSRASVQAGLIRQPRPGQHWGLRPVFALRATTRQASFRRSSFGLDRRQPVRLLAAACRLPLYRSPAGATPAGGSNISAPVTQLPECSPPKAEVAGGSPARSTSF